MAPCVHRAGVGNPAFDFSGLCLGLGCIFPQNMSYLLGRQGQNAHGSVAPVPAGCLLGVPRPNPGPRLRDSLASSSRPPACFLSGFCSDSQSFAVRFRFDKIRRGLLETVPPPLCYPPGGVCVSLEREHGSRRPGDRTAFKHKCWRRSEEKGPLQPAEAEQHGVGKWQRLLGVFGKFINLSELLSISCEHS